MGPWSDELSGSGRYPNDRAVHAPRDGADLERPAQVRAVDPGRDARAGGARCGRAGAGRRRRARAQRAAADAGAGGRARGDDPARRHRLPDGVGGQHDAAVGRCLRAPRHDVVGPARHSARRAAHRGDRRAAGQGRPAGRRPARPRPGAPGHAQGRPHPRRARGAGRVGSPGRRPGLRHGPLAGPAARGAVEGRRRRHLRCRRHLLAHRSVGRAVRGLRAEPAAGRRVHPGGHP
jgi:hypothetical protein